MTNLIPLDAAIAAFDYAWTHTAAIAALRAIPAIDPAAIREAALREAASVATPDQTAAMDKLIAEAEARVWERAERIARNVGVPVGAGDGCGTYIPGTSADAARAILAASKKGGV